ncbi:MAG TPA: Flp family type IVb pilin [Marmoricola sp.]|nr:Flp family type IVb pilin [Marmoricola sp.]
MLQLIQRLVNRKDEKGASAVEYGLLVAAIAALIVVIVFALGGLVNNVFKDTCSKIASGGGTTISNSCDATS